DVVDEQNLGPRHRQSQTEFSIRHGRHIDDGEWATKRPSSAAMSSGANIKSGVNNSRADCGMSTASQVVGSWTTVTPPARCTANAPSAPSALAPVSRILNKAAPYA